MKQPSFLAGIHDDGDAITNLLRFALDLQDTPLLEMNVL
jgi:hypothetical protein